MIGHNAPPAFEAYSLHVEELFELVAATVAGTTVETVEQERALASLADDLRKAKKDVDAARVAEKRPHDDAAAEVQAKYKPLVTRCEMGVEEINRLLTPFREAQQRARNEAAEKVRKEAAALLEAAQAKVRSDDLGDRFAAEAELKAAKKLTVAANKIDRAPTGLRTFWVADLTDARAALNHYAKQQPDALKDWLVAQAQRDVNSGTRAIPGFTVREDRKAA